MVHTSDAAWLDVSRFIEKAANGDEAIRPFAALGVHLWQTHHRRHTSVNVPLVTAVRTGDRCDVCFLGTCNSDTDTIMSMMNDIPQFITQSDIVGVSAQRLSCLARIIASTKAQMDNLEIQTEPTNITSETTEVYIGPVSQFSIVTMLRISRDPGLGIKRVEYTRMENGTGLVSCVLIREQAEEPVSTWSKMKNWFTKDKRKQNRLGRGDKPY